MRKFFRSVRMKLLIPGMAAVLATLVALSVGLALSSRPTRELTRVEQVDFKALQLTQDLVASLEKLHLLHQLVAASGDESRMTEASQLFQTMIERIRFDGPAAMGKTDADSLVSELEAYAKGATAESSRLAQDLRRTRSSGGAAATPSLSDATEDQFSRLRRHFDAVAFNASGVMTDAFEGVRIGQRRAFEVLALILLGAAVLSGLLTYAFAVKISAPLRELSAVALRVASGDLTPDVRVATHDEVGTLAESFQRMVARLREVVSTLKGASEEMASAAEQLTEHTRAQSAMLEQQASGVAETTTTTRELEQTSSVAAARAAAVLDVARRATQMSEAGHDAAERSASELMRIQGSVEGIVGRSTQLLAQARQVGQIVETVRDLAVQSHVLSLNASIEAARAGEAGRGFAVVAQEVRALAEQSGQGAARIGKMVSDILAAVQGTREMTESGAQAMTGSLGQIRTSGDSLREIGAIVQETSDAATQIASAVQQQSTGIAQIAMAMRDLDKGMEEAVERVRALEHSANRVAETATRVSAVAAEFRV